ncbi:hypothetical protein BE11_32415 [Sorangium cellulosum]|nr:hypothetical protein BE11_32415 [Sorangium cellulosum]
MGSGDYTLTIDVGGVEQTYEGNHFDAVIEPGVFTRVFVDYPTAPPTAPPGLEPWQELISYRPSRALQEDLEVGKVFVQRLERHARPINLDYYEVRFSSLPFNPEATRDATRFSSGVQFLEYIRKHLNDFLDHPRFFPYSAADERLWATSRAEGAIKRIELAGDLQWGDVVVSTHELAGRDRGYWRFSTVKTDIDGLHPVSGNREFGIFRDALGWGFYTRGADRYALVFGEAEEAYGKGDALWRALSQNVSGFINKQGSSATVSTPISARYDWYPLCTVYWQPTSAWNGDTIVRDARQCITW